MARGPIDPEDWRKLVRIFETVRDLEPEKQRAHLDEACAGDPALRRRVEDLLRHDSGGEDPLRQIRHAVGHVLGSSPRPGAAESGDTNRHTDLRGAVVGSYRLEEVVGHGGMGTVWRAVRDDAAYSKEVAVKLVRSASHRPAHGWRHQRGRSSLRGHGARGRAMRVRLDQDPGQAAD